MVNTPFLLRSLRARLRRWFSHPTPRRRDLLEQRRLWRAIGPRDEGGDRRLDFWERRTLERDRVRGYRIER